MLSSTLWGAFATPVTYVLIFILLGTAIMQIRYVNKALQRFESTQVIPVQFVMFTLCVILGSAILYRDFEKTTAEQAGKFVGGCLLTFFGVWLITSGRGTSTTYEDEDCLSDTDGVEETIGLLDQEGNPADLSDHEDSQDLLPRSRKPSKHSGININSTDDVVSHGAAGGNSFPTLQLLEPASISGSDENLTTNPWSGVPTTPMAPPRGPRSSRTLSADTVMRGSVVISSPNRSNPATPIREGQSLQIGSPLDQPVTPQTRANTLGHSHHHHRSGPFISPSPLSSTVTTVMKDGFLRGDKKSVSQRPSINHMRSMLRASLFFNDENGAGPSGRSAAAVASEDNLISQQQQEPAEEGTRTRSRSMSDTIGDFFRPKRNKRKEGPNAGVDDDEEEP